jgi:Rod binding domain-containing protein
MSFSIADISRPPAALEHSTRKAAKAAADFEAILLESVMESLSKTFSGVSDGTAGMADYSYMGVQALASAVAAHGGIGIARLILSQWSRTKGPEATRQFRASS